MCFGMLLMLDPVYTAPTLVPMGPEFMVTWDHPVGFPLKDMLDELGVRIPFHIFLGGEGDRKEEKEKSVGLWLGDRVKDFDSFQKKTKGRNRMAKWM
jgi:hypothetical protein